MNYPVIYLAFADDPLTPLKMLEEEGYEVYKCLSGGARKLYFQLYREPFATTQRVADFLLENKERVHIFHYGGHASSTEIFLQEESADAKGIAALLNELQPGLKLVFLNGCSTLGQVDNLLKSNIPAVIATERAIEDKRAKEFAIYFYKALVNGANLEHAFNQAAAMLQTKTGKAPQIYRNLSTRSEQGSVLEWGLYVSDPGILTWQLPAKPSNQIIIRGSSSRYNEKKISVDIRLIQDLFEVLSRYNSHLSNYGAFEQIEQRQLRFLRRDIMDSLPSPLGEQIRKLFSADSGPHAQVMRTVSVERLRQLIYTYEVLMDLVTSIMLAELWESSVKIPELKISEELRSEFEVLFSLGKTERLLYDLSNVIRKLFFLFADNGIRCFVDELENIDVTLFEDEEYLEALQFMEELKKELFTPEQKIDAGEIESLCLQAEVYLGSMFKKWGFCARYNFVSIKGIEVINSRHQATSFVHNKVLLDAVTAGYVDEEKSYPVYGDNSSIILLKTPEDLDSYLSLSPFIIDENALKKRPQARIYIFSHYDKQEDIIYYRPTMDFEQYMGVNAQNFPGVKAQFDQFLNLISKP